MLKCVNWVKTGRLLITVGIKNNAILSLLSVTVADTSSSQMLRGLICQVRKASDPATAVGTFSLMNGETNLQTLDCGGPAMGVTHTNRDDKAMVQFYWTPPGDMGNVKVM